MNRFFRKSRSDGFGGEIHELWEEEPPVENTPPNQAWFHLARLAGDDEAIDKYAETFCNGWVEIVSPSSSYRLLYVDADGMLLEEKEHD